VGIAHTHVVCSAAEAVAPKIISSRMGVLSLLEAAIMLSEGVSRTCWHTRLRMCYLKSKAGAAEISSVSTGMLAEFTTHSTSTNC
jgi:hypothetical protein